MAMESKVREAVERRGYIFISYLPKHGLVYVKDDYNNQFPLFEETVLDWIRDEGVS